MKVTIKKRILNFILSGLMLSLLSLMLFTGIIFNYSFVGAATNITNISVLAKVNVTNSPPNITSIVVDDDSNLPVREIDLLAYSAKNVWCNITVFDFNGAADINATNVSATLHIQSVGREGSSDNNHRYINSSCGSCNALTATTTLCDCKFGVQYYANDSTTWVCNASIRDNGGTATASSKIYLNDTDASNTTTITSLLALNTSTVLDYGNLSATQTSDLKEHNVTNAGNIDLNITLRGYGGTDYSVGQNVTMMCELGNITIGNQRYSLGTQDSGVIFEEMHNLTNQTRMSNFTLPAKQDDSALDGSQNTTYWKLSVPLTVGGVCNGTIVFGAVDVEY